MQKMWNSTHTRRLLNVRANCEQTVHGVQILSHKNNSFSSCTLLGFSHLLVDCCLCVPGHVWPPGQRPAMHVCSRHGCPGSCWVRPSHPRGDNNAPLTMLAPNDFPLLVLEQLGLLLGSARLTGSCREQGGQASPVGPSSGGGKSLAAGGTSLPAMSGGL